MSVVPDLAPGADNAVDAALLLSLLEYFAGNRPARGLLFVFVDTFLIVNTPICPEGVYFWYVKL